MENGILHILIIFLPMIEIEKLSKINIKGKLYLFSCEGGTDKSRNSVAGRFAKLI